MVVASRGAERPRGPPRPGEGAGRVWGLEGRGKGANQQVPTSKLAPRLPGYINTEYCIIRIIQIIRIIHNTASPCRIILSLASSSSSCCCIVEVVVCTLQTWDWTKLAASEPKQSVSKMFSLPKVTHGLGAPAAHRSAPRHPAAAGEMRRARPGSWTAPVCR